MSLTDLIEETQDTCERLDLYVVENKGKILHWLGIPSDAEMDRVHICDVSYTYKDVRLSIAYDYLDLDDYNIAVVVWIKDGSHILTYDELLVLLSSET